MRPLLRRDVRIFRTGEKGIAWRLTEPSFATLRRQPVETGLAPSRLPRLRRRGQPRFYGKSDAPSSERTLSRVVPRSIVRLIRASRRRVRQVHPQLTEFRIRIALRWIVRQQILRPQFVADLAERVVQLRQRRGVVILPARIG